METVHHQTLRPFRRRSWASFARKGPLDPAISIRGRRFPAVTLIAALCMFALFGRQLAAQTNIITSPSAVNIRNALTAGGTILLHFNGTVTLSTPLVISVDGTIMDATGYTVSISGNNVSQVFQVATNVHFTASSFTIANGKVAAANGANGSNGSGNQGNGIGNNGNNGSNGGNGLAGAVKNMGISTWVNCSFLNNSAVGGNGGTGGSGANGINSSAGGNGGNGGGGGSAYGGAIYNLSAIVLSNCTFAGNTVVAGNGAAGGTNGTLQFSGTPFPGNGGFGGAAAGASLYNLASASATIFGCTFSSNSIQAGNTQTLGGSYGANGNGTDNGGNGNPGGSATGGGICNLGTNSIINSSFYANIVTGGNGGNGENACPPYGFFGTYGGAGGAGGSGLGGNIYNSGVMGVTNSTIAVGVVYGGTGGLVGNGLATNKSNGSTGGAAGANIYNIGTLNFKNSILDLPGTATSAAGTITDQGNNISSDGTPTFTQTNSFDNLDPQLSVLTNNGGPTLTFALEPGSPAIYAADSTAAPSQDQRGYYWVTAPSIGAYDSGAIAVPFVQLFTLGRTASEDGDVGMFFVRRSAAGPSGPLTVNFTISGTATNGVNYATITNSVTIASGTVEAQILVRAMPGSFSGNNLSVVLTVSTNTQYSVDTNFVTGTVLLQPQSTFDPDARFVRGTSTAPDFQSLVVPLDSETGVPLAAIGGNATNLFPGNPWTTNFYHYNATNLSSQTGTSGRIVFQNPIVAFGSPVGGSPLYLNQNYQFGIAAGSTVSNFAGALRIQVYYRSNSAYAGTVGMPLPNVASASQLAGLVSNGFTESFTNFGLQTTVLMSQYVEYSRSTGYLAARCAWRSVFCVMRVW